MKIAFWGTPVFAVPILKKLINSKHEILFVVTQPDKPVGRKQTLTPPPIKLIALENNIKFFQPEKVASPEFISEYKKYEIDLNLIVAFGQILPDEIIYHPKHHSINIHASLLPKYRGASPINWAIINGDSETGITYQFIEKKLDAGDIIYQEKIKIESSDNSITLSEKLSQLSSETVLKVLDMIETKNYTRIKQDETKATYVKILKKEDGKLNFKEPAINIFNKIRGLLPWPVAYCTFDGKFLKIFKAEVINSNTGEPGEIIDIIKGKGFVVKAGNDALLICEVQPESGKKMDAFSFAIGQKNFKGKFLQ
jgi:methionyl-tRNA formyltransferase